MNTNVTRSPHVLTGALLLLGSLAACSSDSSTATPNVAVPGAPTSVVGSGGNNPINIVFTAPASNGGAAVTGYTATCSASGSGRTGTATSSPISVTGLTNGTAYTCTVVAVNSAGSSPASSAVTVTPLGVPAAPTGVLASPAQTSASIAFTAPVSNGGAPITSYVATCTAAGASLTGTGSTSPITVSGMTSGTTYSCVVAAISAAGTGTASTAVSVTATQPATGLTSAVGCTLSYTGFNNSPKVNSSSVSSWSCSGTVRALSGNGIPDHAVVGGNFATPMSAQVITQQFSLNPVNTGTVTSTMIVGYALNSVKFDPGTAGTCTSNATSTTPGGGCVAIGGQDPWRIEALGGAFTFGTDENNAHTQPDGSYHYHGMPVGIITRANKGEAMTLVGWSVDGFPIYARYGYSVANSATSATVVMRGSYQKKATPDAGRPSVTIFPMGTFQQDYSYAAASGDLDECNGRTGVTPEFPNGIYHYYITDTYPYIQRCIKGTRLGGGGPPPPPPSR